MKTIKSILGIALFLTCSLTFAQPGGGGQGRQQGPPPIPNDKQIQAMVDNLADELALSSDQEKKVLELYKAHFVQVKKQTSGNNRPNREELEAMKTAFEKKVKAELTKEQTSRYEAYLKKQSNQRPQK
ncbi:MAG: hypothetical protein IH596_01335 [Bacteroidales bacterium]|nr:hypothetical protein [Bacteroidales bacterium]